MTITKQDFDALRALQAQRQALADQEAERTKQLTEAEAKQERLTNMLANALADPNSNWASVDALQQDLASVTGLCTVLMSQEDPVRVERLDDLNRELTTQVAVLAGKEDPFAPVPEPGPEQPPKVALDDPQLTNDALVNHALEAHR